MTGKYILLVEPDQATRRATRRELINHFGVGVKTAETIPKAIKVLEGATNTGRIDTLEVAVAEWGGGYSATDNALSLVPHVVAKFPIIIYTSREGTQLEHIRERAKAYGVVALSKSQDGIDGLKRKIEEICQLRPRAQQ